MIHFWTIGIFFSKDRREEVIEVEEEPETVTVEDCAMPLKLMTQGLWMKGCPEGSEQSFLFGIYSGLTEGECPCPDKCSYSIKRKKQDFFSFYVSSRVDYLKFSPDLAIAHVPRVYCSY